MEKRQSGLNRIIAFIAVLAVLFVVLFSEIIILRHASHHCTGEECPVCAVMAQCSDNIRNLGVFIVFISAALVLVSYVQKKVSYHETLFGTISLVSQKVRMNN